MKKIMQQAIDKGHFSTLKACLILAFCLIVSNAYSLNLATSPLFLGSAITPNVVFLLDDSGSMDWEIMSQKHWTRCAYDPQASGSFSSSNCGWEVTDGVIYTRNGWYSSDIITNLYSNADNAYGQCAGSYSWTMECPDRSDWRAFSSDLNTIAYNPDSTYSPWPGPCLLNGTFCSAANFASARSNPREGESGYTTERSLDSHEYHVWIDDAGYSGSRPRRGSVNNYVATANTEIDYWDTHLRIRFSNNGQSATIDKISYAPNSSGVNSTVTTLATLNTPGVCYNALGPQNLVEQIAAGTLAANSSGGSGCRSITQSAQNFANWYQYDRRRSFSAKSAISSVVQTSPGFRYGLTVTKNHTDLFSEVPASDISYTLTHNNALLANLYAYDWRPTGTPLRRGLERVGRYYNNALDGKTDPIISACQQNFTILLTDGYWNGDSPLNDIGNSDGDPYSSTLADVANYYYTTDLSPLENQVPGNARDPVHHQHMVTFGVAFGVSGHLSDTDDDGWPNPTLLESSNWGNPFYSDLSKIDDLWHATYNSRGTFVAAQTPTAVAEQLSTALTDIHTRISSAASVAQNTSILSDESRVYQTQFNSADWKGHLLAFPISESGISANASWDAGCRLTGGACLTALNPSDGLAENDRVILTYNPETKQGIPFRFPSDYENPSNSELSQTQITALLSGVSSDWQTVGENRLAYLRGERSNEQQNGGNFRNRSSLLGDFIHSSPAYVGPPIRRYSENLEASSYNVFKATYANRETVIYVGANEGMLHGFNVATGDEMLAYIPADRTLFNRLYQLTDPNFTHEYFVDGSPRVVDAYINGHWRTLLAGSLNAGGQGIFALDVTDPSQFSEANAASVVLWEFTDEDDARMGFSFSEPQIGRLHNGQWAVIIGNGYNSAAADGFAAESNQSALIILFIDGGLDGNWTENADYFVIPVGSGSGDNGLSTPSLVDTNGDNIVDYIYAGDLLGHVWRFDVTDPNPSSWTGNLLFETGSTQPITTAAAPTVGRHPSGEGVMVYFGTGKYLEATDNSNTNQSTQTFYGLYDRLDGNTVLSSDLLDQQILGTQNVNGNTVRISTNNPIDWALHKGWKMDLIDSSVGDNQGERVVSQAILRSGRIIFTTIIPSDNSCTAGGSSWIMELDAISGSRLMESAFDLNSDYLFNSEDLINAGDLDGNGEPDFISASGLQSTVGITAKPTILLTQDRSREIKVISGSSGLDSFSENPGLRQMGRQNWKRLK